MQGRFWSANHYVDAMDRKCNNATIASVKKKEEKMREDAAKGESRDKICGFPKEERRAKRGEAKIKKRWGGRQNGGILKDGNDHAYICTDTERREERPQ